MDTRAIDQTLAALRAAADVAANRPVQSPPSGTVEFADVLKGALQNVSQGQDKAQQMAQSFTLGDKEVALQDVMINLQKASLSFQQLVQVRNKLVSAYQEIINMHV